MRTREEIEEESNQWSDGVYEQISRRARLQLEVLLDARDLLVELVRAPAPARIQIDPRDTGSKVFLKQLAELLNQGLSLAEATAQAGKEVGSDG